ncbi:AMP-binding protein [Tsukamurella sp. 1534]|uniref:AMP-binding protein n=1 Tax=Tsukamurella sp. 1534 TaxID=1151061 RepID=UPI00031BF9BE|nr:AMP-binding protein [Tsukamurella sp. 1534]
MENALATLADTIAATDAARPAFVGDDFAITYADLTERIAAARAALRDTGVRPGDRVAISLASAPEFAVAFYATLGVGAVAVPVNPALTPREASFYLEDSGAVVLVRRPGAEWAGSKGLRTIGPEGLQGPGGRREVAAVAPDTTAVLLYTSGTTGVPKGAELTHDNLVFNATALSDPAIIGPSPGDVVAGILPLFHTMGLTVLNVTLLCGAAMWPIEKFDGRRIAELIDGGKISILSGVPTHLQMIMAASDDLSLPAPLRRVSTAGSELPASISEWVKARLGTSVIEGYGLTEASPTVAYNRADTEIRPGSVGRPVPGVDVQIVDPNGDPAEPGSLGHIHVRGPNVMKGYWNQPRATSETVRNGWLATGDVGRVDADGYLYVVDRLKQIIIRAGYNVYPREIETVLSEHPAVAAAVVVGVPDARVGEEIAAFVLGTGAPITEDELRRHASTNLAAYKTPRRYFFTSEFPRTATGKIARAELRDSLLRDG